MSKVFQYRLDQLYLFLLRIYLLALGKGFLWSSCISGPSWNLWIVRKEIAAVNFWLQTIFLFLCFYFFLIIAKLFFSSPSKNVYHRLNNSGYLCKTCFTLILLSENPSRRILWSLVKQDARTKKRSLVRSHSGKQSKKILQLQTHLGFQRVHLP